MRDWTLYKEIRDQIKHEDGLTGQRMTWLMQLQSFLFGAYGFTAGVDPAKPIIRAVHVGFPIAGTTSALLIYFAIKGSLTSVRLLTATWRQSDEAKDPGFPPIIGTYTEDRPQGTGFGSYPVRGIPIALCLVWLLMFVINWI